MESPGGKPRQGRNRRPVRALRCCYGMPTWEALAGHVGEMQGTPWFLELWVGREAGRGGDMEGGVCTLVVVCSICVEKGHGQ